uniref:Uncharacterized protein n=1 Tax=Oryza glumipatula TaxID=40148 RepID=A0A0E0A8N5_9ORYZ
MEEHHSRGGCTGEEVCKNQYVPVCVCTHGWSKKGGTGAGGGNMLLIPPNIRVTAPPRSGNGGRREEQRRRSGNGGRREERRRRGLRFGADKWYQSNVRANLHPRDWLTLPAV